MLLFTAAGCPSRYRVDSAWGGSSPRTWLEMNCARPELLCLNYCWKVPWLGSPCELFDELRVPVPAPTWAY